MSGGIAPGNEAARRLVERFTADGRSLATAESCTGGLVAAALTDISGSSAVLDRGFVTYSNAAKTEMLAVPAALIERHGAVSESVARAMAEGALLASSADVALSVTGIAGPGGGTAEKPVGLVHFALADKAVTTHRMERFAGPGRAAIRRAAIAVALAMLQGWIDDQAAGDPARRSEP